MELRWMASQSASCLYAVNAVRCGRSLVDEHLASALAEPGKLLCSAVKSVGAFGELFWQHLLPQSARVDNNRQLVEVALKKLPGVGSRLDTLVKQLAGPVGDVETAVQRELPELPKELASQSQRLGEAWLNHGQSLLSAIAQNTDENLIVPSAEVIAVPQTVESGGTAHLLYNSVSVEAAPQDPHPNLPDVLRLCWMLSQLNIDMPIFGENIHHDHWPLVGSLAMLPAILIAAEQAELAQFNQATLQRAIEAWHVESLMVTDPGEEDRDQVDLAETTWQWWSTFTGSRPPWNVAITALDRMLH